VAVGQMGMRPCDFEDMTPAEFIYAWNGFARRKQDEERAAWERTRWQIWTLTCIQLMPKDRAEMKAMFPLPWDEPIKKALELTPEQRKQRVQEILQECSIDIE
jgi:hypothetical protein